MGAAALAPLQDNRDRPGIVRNVLDFDQDELVPERAKVGRQGLRISPVDQKEQQEFKANGDSKDDAGIQHLASAVRWNSALYSVRDRNIASTFRWRPCGLVGRR